MITFVETNYGIIYRDKNLIGCNLVTEKRLVI